MRISFVFCFIMAALAAPAIAADDQSTKQQVEKLTAEYAENFNKQNSAGIAALFTTDGVLLNATGPHTDIAQVYDGAFKAGLNHHEITVKQATALGADSMLGMGEYVASGKNASGASIEVAGFRTSTYVRDGGGWKIRMLTAFPKASPPPK